MRELLMWYSDVVLDAANHDPAATLRLANALSRLADGELADALRASEAITEYVQRETLRRSPDDDGALEDAAAEDGWEPAGGWLDGGPEDARG